jgi:microcystin-dependent protein
MPASAKRAAAKKPLPKATAPASGPYLGQIEAFGFGFAPAGWLPCDGRTMSIQQNNQLFSLLGTNYGGNGVTTFALPKLPPIGPSGPHYFIAVNAPYPPQG